MSEDKPEIGAKKFQYLHVTSRGFGTSEERIDDLGSIGWELVCQDQSGLRFKREIGTVSERDVAAFEKKYNASADSTDEVVLTGQELK